MTFSQLIEYNKRNVFFEKSYTKFCGKTSPKTFSGKLKLSVSLIASQVEDYQNLLKPKLQATCFYLVLSIFKR